MDSYFAYTSLLAITISIICIALTWWALQALKFEQFTHKPKSSQTKTLQIILSIVIGYQLAKFFIDYLGWSTNLKSLF